MSRGRNIIVLLIHFFLRPGLLENNTHGMDSDRLAAVTVNQKTILKILKLTHGGLMTTNWDIDLG